MKKLNLDAKFCITCNAIMLNEGKFRVSQTRWKNKKYCSLDCKKVESRLDYSKSKICPTCEMTFYRKENQRGYTWLNKIYCSPKCANTRKERTHVVKTCVVCGNPYRPKGNQVKRKTCSSKCAGILLSANMQGEKHRAWGGGRVTTKQGYIRVWVADDNPFVSMRPKGSNHILEHRLVMAEKIGRPLLKTETVHHKNGIRNDNRPENLELRTGQHGVGATVHCPTCTCNQDKEL